MDYFKEQLKWITPLTEEVLSEVKGKYYSGRQYGIGDNILYAMLLTDKGDMELITLHEDEVDDYFIVPEKCIEGNMIPAIRKK